MRLHAGCRAPRAAVTTTLGRRWFLSQSPTNPAPRGRHHRAIRNSGGPDWGRRRGCGGRSTSAPLGRRLGPPAARHSRWSGSGAHPTRRPAARRPYPSYCGRGGDQSRRWTRRSAAPSGRTVSNPHCTPMQADTRSTICGSGSMNGTSGRTPRRGSSFGPGPRCERRLGLAALWSSSNHSHLHPASLHRRCYLFPQLACATQGAFIRVPTWVVARGMLFHSPQPCLPMQARNRP